MQTNISDIQDSRRQSGESQKHNICLRVYYQDTDAGGVVYHASYLNFAERARTEFLRDLDFAHKDLQEQANLIFVVKNLHIDFLAAAKLDDELHIVSDIARIGGASLHMRQIFYRKLQPLANMQVVLVAVNSHSFSPQAIPQALKQKFLPYVQQSATF